MGILIDLVILAKKNQYGDCVISGDSGEYGYFDDSCDFGESNLVILIWQLW